MKSSGQHCVMFTAGTTAQCPLCGVDVDGSHECGTPAPTPELIDIVGIMGALKEATETLRPKRKRRVR